MKMIALILAVAMSIITLALTLTLADAVLKPATAADESSQIPVDKGGRAAPGAGAATGRVSKQWIGPAPEEPDRDKINPLDVLELYSKIVDNFQNSEEAKALKKMQDAAWEKQRKLCLAGLVGKRQCAEVLERELINRMLEDLGEDR